MFFFKFIFWETKKKHFFFLVEFLEKELPWIFRKPFFLRYLFDVQSVTRKKYIFISIFGKMIIIIIILRWCPFRDSVGFVSIYLKKNPLSKRMFTFLNWCNIIKNVGKKRISTEESWNKPHSCNSSKWTLQLICDTISGQAGHQHWPVFMGQQVVSRGYCLKKHDQCWEGSAGQTQPRVRLFGILE